MWHSLLEKILVKEEGLRTKPYTDIKGLWTYGVGRLIGSRLEDLKISEATAYQMLDEDITEKSEQACMLFGESNLKRQSMPRQHAMVGLVFQLGYGQLQRDFTSIVPAIRGGNFELACKLLESTLVAKQTPARIGRVVQMLRHEHYPEYYGL